VLKKDRDAFDRGGSMREAISQKIGALAAAVVADARWKNETLNAAILGMILYGYALAVGRMALMAEIEDVDAAVRDCIIKYVGAGPKWTAGLVEDANLSALDKDHNPANFELVGVGHSYFGVENQAAVLDNVFANVKAFGGSA
jgi:hypothetical protein